MSGMLQIQPTPLVVVSEPAGLAGAAVGFTFGPFPLYGILGGRLRGSAAQDVAGVLLLEFGQSASNLDLQFTVDQDVDQPPGTFQYPFDVIVLAPFFRVSFTNGGAASSFFRASVEALPV